MRRSNCAVGERREVIIASRFIRRALLPLAVVSFVPCFATAQEAAVGGYAIDRETNRPLPCIDATLEDTAGKALGRVRTDHQGSFVLPVPQPGTFRVRFTLWAGLSLYSPWDTLTTEDHMRRFLLPIDSLTNTYRYEALQPRSDDVRPKDIKGAPRYPSRLRSQRRSGNALVSFVVDSLGAVERGSIFLKCATHREFGDAVLGALPHFEFFPARRDGQPVCAYVQMPFQFSVAGGDTTAMCG